MKLKYHAKGYNANNRYQLLNSGKKEFAATQMFFMGFFFFN
jgi:hypothetical protein